MNQTSSPLVTVGLPVYNGEKLLGRAIESILAQSFTDFALVLFDNDSDDGTRDICLGYEKQDRRVTYRKNDVNVGAAKNFNNAVYSADTRYFKWAAHDDWIAPTFLEQCLEGLEAEPGAVCCWANTLFVDEEQAALAEQPLRGDPGALDPSSPLRRRFHEALRIHPGPVVFGLFRTDQLKQTHLMRGSGSGGSDRLLIAELSLLGGFAFVPDRLLYYVHYPKERVGYYTPDWWNPGSKSRRQFLGGFGMQALQCGSLVTSAELGAVETTALLGEVAATYGVKVAKRLAVAGRRQLLRVE